MKKSLLSAIRIAACVLTLTPLAGAAETPRAQAAGQVDLARLDIRLQEFSSRFYPKFVRVEKPAKFGSIEALTGAIEALRAKGQDIQAVAAVIHNINVVEKNIDTNAVVPIIDLLLQVNEWKTASRLYDKLKEQGDKALVANVSLSLADYYFTRNQWEQTVQVAQSIAGDDLHRARLIHGIALQRLRKHRPALAQYAKIPKTSRHYTAARLNTAIANIRQDWWTDAHKIMQELIDRGGINDVVQTDRLYTVWGYSLLRQQYFRNARDIFRNVSQEGPYTNKALLGIALSAAYQNDYIGALNAIRILKNKNTYDLPVDEANLLMPYVYEKLEQRTTAMAGYAQAIKYYEERIAGIEKLMPVDAARLREQFMTGGVEGIAVDREVLDLKDKLPEAFFANFKVVASFQPHLERLGDPALQREYAALNRDYADALQKTVQSALSEKIAYLNHYMSQARFGLATVNDNSGAVPQ